jgi:prepilin-type N-terminal cleavage/methylation domain-containing protein
MKRFRSHSGFTLIELIVTLAVVAVISAVLYQYFGTSFTHSSVPIFRLQKSFALQQVMENITTDYLDNYASSLPGLQLRIGAEGIDQSNSYGNYTVIENRFIKFTGRTEAAWEEGDPRNMLKVMVANEENESLTVIFVQ